MIHSRHLGKQIMVLVLLSSSLALATSPATAQTGLDVYSLESKEPPADNDEDPVWTVQITVESAAGCTPTEEEGGSAGYVSGWLGAGDSPARVLLNTDVCNYRITAVARNSKSPGMRCEAGLAWGDVLMPAEDYLDTRTNMTSETTISVMHTTDCYIVNVAKFRIDPDHEDIVEPLPRHSRDIDLVARAKRAVEVTDFQVRVEPDESTARRAGCDQTFTLTVRGDGKEVDHELESSPRSPLCKFRAFIVGAPEPFDVIDKDGKLFSTDDRSDDGEIPVNLSGMVQLPYARISIVQDATNPGGEGRVSYTILRSCAGVDSLPPPIGVSGRGVHTLPGGQQVADLIDARGTVHSDQTPNFGAGASYPAVARSLTSSTIVGCSVSVTAGFLPEHCVVTGGNVQTLTWRATNPLNFFDFEFQINCSGGPAQPTGSDLPPPLPSTSDSADVRISARQLANGKIEFGLQQLEGEDTWGNRRLPTLRFFPADARVGRWRHSSSVSVSVAAMAGEFAEEFELRIVARKRSSGAVEFGLQERQDGGSWGDRQFPTLRYFPADARVGRWLRSSALDLSG